MALNPAISCSFFFPKYDSFFFYSRLELCFRCLLLLLESLCSPRSTNHSKCVFWIISLVFCSDHGMCSCIIIRAPFPSSCSVLSAFSPAVSKPLKFAHVHKHSFCVKTRSSWLCLLLCCHFFVIYFFYYCRHI